MSLSIRDLEPSSEGAIEALEKWNKDIKSAAQMLSHKEARFLVDCYYQMQKQRITTNAQKRTAMESGEPNLLVDYFASNFETIENNIKKAMFTYAMSQPVGEWSLSICGIGPVLAGGLLAHINIEKCPTIGSLWKYAGYDPTMVWGKGQKRPFNGKLKTLCWKIGQSFIKVHNNDSDFYGKLLMERREYEMSMNDRNMYAEQAAKGAARVGKTTEAYKSYSIGQLPPAHILMRSQRWAVKLFLGHWLEIACEVAKRPLPPMFMFTEAGKAKMEALGKTIHSHVIPPHNWPMVKAEKPARKSRAKKAETSANL